MSEKYSLAHLCDDDCCDCLANVVYAAAAAPPEAAPEAVVSALSGVFGAGLIQKIIDAIKAGASNLPAVLVVIKPIIDQLAPQYAKYVDVVISILLKIFVKVPVVSPAPGATA